jgi:hypothetical protein
MVRRTHARAPFLDRELHDVVKVECRKACLRSTWPVGASVFATQTTLPPVCLARVDFVDLAPNTGSEHCGAGGHTAGGHRRCGVHRDRARQTPDRVQGGRTSDVRPRTSISTFLSK